MANEDTPPLSEALTLIRKLPPDREEDEYLPCPHLPIFKQIQVDDTEETLNKADLEVANFQLQFINEAWPYVKSITTLSKLVDTTIKATIHRRAILKVAYGVGNKGSKGDVFNPLD